MIYEKSAWKTRKHNANGISGEEWKFEIREKHFQSTTQGEVPALYTLKDVILVISSGKEISYPPLCSILYVDVCLEDPLLHGKDTEYDKGHKISMMCMLPSAYCAGDKETLLISITYNEGQLFPLMIDLPCILFNFLWSHPRPPSLADLQCPLR